MSKNNCVLTLGKDAKKQTSIKKLKGYKVASVLGKGGYSIVYLLKLENKKKDHSYVIKTVNLSYDSNKIKFQKEREIFKKLSTKSKDGIKCIHDNINCYLMVEDHNNCGYILTEYYDMDLGKYLKVNGSFSQRIQKRENKLKLYFNWIHQLTDVITFLHINNIGHGDIKPENILVRLKDNQIVVTDFDSVCIKRGDDVCYVKEFSYL